MFYCEFCNIFKNTFFPEYLRATASENTILSRQCYIATDFESFSFS